MAHIRVADLKSVLTPPVDLRRGRSPKYVVEEHVAETAVSESVTDRAEKKALRSRIERRRFDRRGEESMRELFGPTSCTSTSQITNSGF